MRRVTHSVLLRAITVPQVLCSCRTAASTLNASPSHCLTSRSRLLQNQTHFSYMVVDHSPSHSFFLFFYASVNVKALIFLATDFHS